MLKLPDSPLTTIEAPRSTRSIIAVPSVTPSLLESSPEHLRWERQVADAQEGSAPRRIERTELLTLLSAWFTLAKMEQTGTTFDEFIEVATSTDPLARLRALSAWSDLVNRLATAAQQALGNWPEAVLTPEIRAFIEALIAMPPEAP